MSFDGYSSSASSSSSIDEAAVRERVPFANSVNGRDAQLVMEKVTREKVYAAEYWKSACFGANEEAVVKLALQLRYVGATYGGLRRVCPFVCLLLKLLQLKPARGIVDDLLQSGHKYVTCLALAYVRLVGRPRQVYAMLEPFYADYRKVVRREIDGSFSVIHMDEFVDTLLHEDTLVDLLLPRLPERRMVEETTGLPKYVSPLARELAEASSSDEDEVDGVRGGALNLKKRRAEDAPGDDAKRARPAAAKDGAMDVDETNRLRISLGLKPLQG